MRSVWKAPASQTCSGTGIRYRLLREDLRLNFFCSVVDGRSGHRLRLLKLQVTEQAPENGLEAPRFLLGDQQKKDSRRIRSAPAFRHSQFPILSSIFPEEVAQ